MCSHPLETSIVAKPVHRIAQEPVHPIELESFRILRGRIDLSAWGPVAAEVVARVVHATADVALGQSMVLDDAAAAAGIAALAADAPVLCDVEMVRAGLPHLTTMCYLAAAQAGPAGVPTRSAAAAELAARAHPAGAVAVAGCAPTALERWSALIESGAFRPALVVALPVGFVGAAEAKAHLREVAHRSNIACISNIGERGGSAAACGAVNALARLARPRPR